MSQDYSFIVTDENLNIPEDIISFKVRNLTTFPLNLEGYVIKSFIENKKNEINNRELDNDELQIVFLLEKVELINKKFIIVHTSDWADIPVDEFQAGFVNGKLIKESIYLNDSQDVTQKYNNAFEIMNYNPNFFRQFKDFYFAKIEFDKYKKN